MPISLKSIASKVFGADDEIDVILAMEITKLRLELKEAYQNKKFGIKKYESFIERLSKLADISGQAAIAYKAAKDREVENTLDIELNNETKQLLWAATLTYMMETGTEPVSKSRLWDQIQSSIGVYNEGITIANIISASLQNDEVTFDWGQPGSWFYRDPRNNHMNFDLYYMLLVGFEHIRAVELHEMGHSDLSVGYPPSMKKLYDLVSPSIDPRTIKPADEDAKSSGKKSKAKSAQKTKEEQVALALLVKEWKLRHGSWNTMEDITVDQYAINMSQRMPQDFGYSMNHAATDLRGYGEIIRGDDLKKPVSIFTDNAPEQARQISKQYDEHIKRLITPLTAQEIADVKSGKISVEVASKMFEEIQRATLLAGYVKNNLFSDTAENFERFRVFKQDISSVVDISGLADAKSRDAFRYLFDICAEGNDSIRLLQPKASDRFVIRDGHRSITESYRATVKETNEKRNEIMETIWNVYLKPFADVLIQDYAKKLEERLEEKQKQQKNGNGSDKSEGSPGQDGDPQQGQGSGNSGDPSEGQGDGDPMDMDEQLEDDAGDMSETPEEGRKKQNGQDEQNKDDAGQGQDAGDDADGQDDKQKKDKSAGADGEEDKDADANENGDGSKADQKADGKDGQDAGKDEKSGGPGWDKEDDKGKPKNPKRVSDVKNKSKVDDKPMSSEQKKALKEKADNMAEPDPNALSNSAGSGDGLDLAQLSKGNWSDFNRRMIELSPVINRLADSYKKIREEQKRQIQKESRDLDFMAEDGDIMARLDRDKVLETKFRQATGQKMTPDDFQKFKEDKTHSIHSTIEMVYMIDGSGSMPGVILANGTTAMEAALQSAAIGYMACRKAGIDSYILIWGNKIPQVVATPKSDLKEVGRALEALRRGTGSGTDLAPGLVKTIESMAAHKNNNGTISGSSHILVYSDGDIADAKEAAKVLEIVSRNAKNMSIDVAVLKNKTSVTDMENVFQGIVDKTGDRIVGLVNGSDPQKIPLELARLMLKRVKSFKIKSEPDSKKRQRLRDLHGKIKK